MSKLVWDQTGQKIYETGLDKGVLYPIDDKGEYSKGYAWNGLSNITESPSGAEATAIYADNIKYLNLYSAEEFGFTIEAYTYPKEFKKCDGSAEITKGVTIGQQARSIFGMAYSTIVGNDVKAAAYGKQIHLVYGAQCSPSEKSRQSVNDSPEAVLFSWECNTTPVNVTGFQPTSVLTIDSTEATPEQMAAIEAVLYGTDEAEPRLPYPDEVAEIMESALTEP